MDEKNFPTDIFALEISKNRRGEGKDEKDLSKDIFALEISTERRGEG